MSMGLYSGRAYYRRIFASEIWGTYLRERGVGGIMEFYGINILLSGVTVNFLVSDHPWFTRKWSLTRGGRLREKSTN